MFVGHFIGLGVSTSFVALNNTLFHGNELDIQGSVAKAIIHRESRTGITRGPVRHKCGNYPRSRPRQPGDPGDTFHVGQDRLPIKCRQRCDHQVAVGKHCQ